jgi:hypothetical protein
MIDGAPEKWHDTMNVAVAPSSVHKLTPIRITAGIAPIATELEELIVRTDSTSQT